MADLVRDHVRLREIARRAEPLVKRVVEPEGDVDLLVDRAVERAHRRLARAAARLHVIAEEHELGVAILPTVLGQDLRPHALCIVEHERHELDQSPFFRGLFDRALLGRGRGNSTSPASAPTEDVAPEEKSENQDDKGPADAHPFPDGKPATSKPAPPAQVLDVFASPAGCPAHDSILRWIRSYSQEVDPDTR